MLEELKKELIIYLEQKQKELQNFEKSSKVYNVLTLEVIKVILMMMKFGLFNTKTDENIDDFVLKQSSSPLGRMTLKSPLKFNLFGSSAIVEKTEIEKVVQYLAVILEYDEAYFDALKDLEIKRSKSIFI